MSQSGQSRSHLRLLVGITSYGTRNLELLKKVIGTYQGMSFEVDVLVFSEAPKDLGPGVEVIVGLPSPNPWSLGFAHKPAFAQRLEQYDLFAYSEDDMDVTERNVSAFLEVTPHLEPDEIAGFMRYEVSDSGEQFLPDVFHRYHWEPGSVCHRGRHTIARFTNEHSAFYLLTQEQMRRAVGSGGYLRTPCQGQYDMLCTAATDPYTNCGFKKVICISRFQDFLIHHMSNRYAGHWGLPLSSFKSQIRVLEKIGKSGHPTTRLCVVEPKIADGQWAKSYYETSYDELWQLVPEATRTVLVIGCGWGAAEEDLVRRGVKVTALPLDSLIGGIAEERDIEVIYASLQEGLEKLKDRRFDAIVLRDLLHLLPDPAAVLKASAQLLDQSGVVLIAGPNFDYLPLLARQVLRLREHEKLRSFSEGGVHPLTPRQVNRWARHTGLHCDRVLWQQPEVNESVSGAVAKKSGFGRFPQGAFRAIRKSLVNLDSKCGGYGRDRVLHSVTMWLRPGPLLAQRWAARAVKQA